MKKLLLFLNEHSKLKFLTKVVVDFIIAIFSYFVAFFCVYILNNKDFLKTVNTYQVAACGFIFAILLILTWSMAGKHRFMWQGTSNREFLRIIYADIYLFAFLYVISKLLRKITEGFIPGGTVVLSSIVLASIISITAVKVAKQIKSEQSIQDLILKRKKRTMIVGAGWAGTFAITALLNGDKVGYPVVVVDDDKTKAGHTLVGVPVREDTSKIEKYAKEYRVSNIIIAITTLPSKKMQEIVSACKKTGCRVTIMSKMTKYDETEHNDDQVEFRELNIADFLSRDEIKLDTASIDGYLKGKRIIVTGGGGSIGSELCRQILKFRPEKLIIFDIYENSAYELQQEIFRKYGKDAPIKVLIGSIRDKKRLDEVFETEKPSIVFHAAAHKHVPLMEDSPAEAIKNNVLGTYNLISSASEHSVERFVQISTDKAVNPTNVMGATKRMCEMLTQCFAKKSEMKCMAVRFGNVLGSHGSVIPLFESQIKNGGPVTVTHPDIIRYFMTIPEAAQLVLQAGSSNKSGEIYVLDMGEPVKIKDLACNLIRFYGYEPDEDIKIEYTGLRPGEKLYEELLMDEEEDKMGKTGHEKIFVAHPFDFDEDVLMEQIDILAKSSEHNDIECVKALASVVTTFSPDYERAH